MEEINIEIVQGGFVIYWPEKWKCLPTVCTTMEELTTELEEVAEARALPIK